MGVVTFGLLAPALVLAAPVPADPVERWRPLIEEAARRTGLPAQWIAEVMRAESGGRTEVGGRPVRSAKGAIGLMQLMPATWADMRAQLGLGDDPDDPRDNILAGAFYLRAMYDRFGHPGMFAAYNAGPARYAAYLAGRARLPSETIAYLAKVAAGSVAAPAAQPAAPPIFIVLRGATAAPAAPEQSVPQPSLFAIRKVEP